MKIHFDLDFGLMKALVCEVNFFLILNYIKFYIKLKKKNCK
jgi:hypothetical protein